MNAPRYKVRNDGSITLETPQERERREENRADAVATRDRLLSIGRPLPTKRK